MWNIYSIRQLDHELVEWMETLIGRQYIIHDVCLTVTAVLITKGGVVWVQNHRGGYHKLSEIGNDLVEIEVTK